MKETRRPSHRVLALVGHWVFFGHWQLRAADRTKAEQLCNATERVVFADLNNVIRETTTCDRSLVKRAFRKAPEDCSIEVGVLSATGGAATFEAINASGTRLTALSMRTATVASHDRTQVGHAASLLSDGS
jgi:hypothetical protein